MFIIFIQIVLIRHFLSYVVNFGNFMAGNFLGGNFFGPDSLQDCYNNIFREGNKIAIDSFSLFRGQTNILLSTLIIIYSFYKMSFQAKFWKYIGNRYTPPPNPPPPMNIPLMTIPLFLQRHEHSLLYEFRIICIK